MRSLVFALLLVASAARADLVTRNSKGDELHLGTGACENASVLAAIKPEWHDKFQAGFAIVSGKRYEACWIEEDEDAIVFFENDTSGVYPLAHFRQSGV